MKVKGASVPAPVSHLPPSPLIQIPMCANVHAYAYVSMCIKEETVRQSIFSPLCVDMFAGNEEFKWETPHQETKCNREALHPPVRRH